MARVLSYTAGQHCRGWDVQIAALAPVRVPLASGPPSFEANTQKLGYWNDRVQMAADGDRVLLMDADTAILRPLDPAWDHRFDLAYTVRPPGYPHPFNGGVIFLRVSPTVRRFMAAWVAENLFLLKDRRYRKPWRSEYGGVNQASFAHMLALPEREIAVLKLPCAEWNCEDSAWTTFHQKQTRILHIKGELRILALCPQTPKGPLAGPACVWRDLDSEARRQVA